MPYILYVRHTRPNTDVEFWEKSPSHQAAVDALKEAGDIVSYEVTLTKDNLTRVAKTTFADKEKYMAYLENSEINSGKQETKEYNQANGITVKSRHLEE